MGNKESKEIKEDLEKINVGTITKVLTKHLSQLNDIESTCKAVINGLSKYTDYETNSSIQVIVSGKIFLTIKSGSGLHQIILVGDNYNVQVASCEITIRTDIISGVFLSCSDNFKMILPELYTIDQSLEKSLCIAKEFVQKNRTGWDNATISINAPLPIHIIAGDGRNHFTIDEMERELHETRELKLKSINEKKMKYEKSIESYIDRQTRRTTNDTSAENMQIISFDVTIKNLHLDVSTQVNVLNKRSLAKMKVILCGNEGNVSNKDDRVVREGVTPIADEHSKLSKIFDILVDEYQKKTEKNWDNMLITIYHDDETFSLRSGKGQHRMNVFKSGKVSYE